MQIRCPCCGATTSLEHLIAVDDARLAIERALKLSPIGPDIIRYLSLFRPAKRALSWERVATILGELAPMFESSQITWEARDYPAPKASIRAAIEVLMQMRASGNLTTPLGNHNLLRSIIARRHEQAQAKAERAREDQLRSGAPPMDARMPPQPGAPIPPPQPSVPEGYCVTPEGKMIPVAEHLKQMQARLRGSAAPSPEPGTAPPPSPADSSSSAPG